MHADFSVELGRDDAALELPWSSADSAVRYYDLKNHPELLQRIPEAAACPELGAFLGRINAAGFPLATAKCDTWSSGEVAPEEAIYGDRKFVSYIDLVFEDEVARGSFEKHEAFARELCRLLGHAPEIPAAVELVIRRCYYHGGEALPDAESREVEMQRTRSDASVEEVDEKDAAVEAEDVEKKGGGAEDLEVEDREETGSQKTNASEEAVERRSMMRRSMVRQEMDREKMNAEDADRRAAGRRTWQREETKRRIGFEGGAVGEEQAEAEVEAAGRSEPEVEDEQVWSKDSRAALSGFYLTAYVTGFGDSDYDPRRRWQIAMALLQNALVQWARN